MEAVSDVLDTMRWPWIDVGSYSWAIMSTILSLFFLPLFGFVTYCLCRMIYFGHKFPSYLAVVLCLLYLWTASRAIYFLKHVTPIRSAWWSYLLENIFCWLPLNFQYFIFSMLPIYYAKLEYGSKWKGTNQRVYIATWIVGNAILMGLTIGWLAVVGDTIEGPWYLVLTRYLLTITCDFAMAIILFVFGFRVRDKSFTKTPKLNFKSWRTIFGQVGLFNPLLILCFSYRTITSSLFVFILYTPWIDYVIEEVTYNVFRFFNFLVAEVSVIILLLFVLGIPSKSKYAEVAHEQMANSSTFLFKQSPEEDDDEDEQGSIVGKLKIPDYGSSHVSSRSASNKHKKSFLPEDILADKYFYRKNINDSTVDLLSDDQEGGITDAEEFDDSSSDASSYETASSSPTTIATTPGTNSAKSSNATLVNPSSVDVVSSLEGSSDSPRFPMSP